MEKNAKLENHPLAANCADLFRAPSPFYWRVQSAVSLNYKDRFSFNDVKI